MIERVEEAVECNVEFRLTIIVQRATLSCEYVYHERLNHPMKVNDSVGTPNLPQRVDAASPRPIRSASFAVVAWNDPKRTQIHRRDRWDRRPSQNSTSFACEPQVAQCHQIPSMSWLYRSSKRKRCKWRQHRDSSLVHHPALEHQLQCNNRTLTEWKQKEVELHKKKTFTNQRNDRQIRRIRENCHLIL